MGAHDEAIADQRAQFIGLLDAVTPADDLRAALAMRIEAKMAHAQVLTQVSFAADEVRARWARLRARQDVSQCLDMLLSQ